MRNRRRNPRRGQALVEMAILFPFFLLIVVGGIIDFGFAFYNILTLQQITDDVCMRLAENSRYSSPTSNTPIVPTDGSTQAFSLKPSWWAGDFQPSISPAAPVPGFANHHYIRVSITYQSQTYTPFYQVILSSTAAVYGIPAR
ncbi:MAG TPA: pilus assembly protein, partial [Candidatus Ozemobacteraceae bacterium]|nr:pilus assembly protein [Candidatus Ozemobacteraceae bacterium]